MLPDGAQLNAVHILCRVLISLMKPGKEELDRMGAKFIEKMTKRAVEITVELNRSMVFSPLDAAM